MGLEKRRSEGNDEKRANLVVDAPTGLIHKSAVEIPSLLLPAAYALHVSPYCISHETARFVAPSTTTSSTVPTRQMSTSPSPTRRRVMSSRARVVMRTREFFG